MIIVDKATVKKIELFLMDYETKQLRPEELAVIDKTMSFFHEINKPQYVLFIVHYFGKHRLYAKDYTPQGVMDKVSMDIVGYESSTGYRMKKHIINRMAYEMAKGGLL